MSSALAVSPLQYAIKLLAQRSYTEKKMREKLSLRDYLPEEIETTIAKLKDKHYLDDRMFAEDYLRLRVSRKLKAAEVFIQELLVKGVPFEIAREAVTKYCPAENEEKIAREFVEHKKTQFAALQPFERNKKLAGMLARRGFRPDIVRRVLNGLDLDSE